MTYEFVSFEPDGDGDGDDIQGTMTLISRWRPFPWIFVKEQTQKLQFHGNVTVWHKLPDFRRPGILMEAMLADFKSRWDYERQRKGSGAHRQGVA